MISLRDFTDGERRASDILRPHLGLTRPKWPTLAVKMSHPRDAWVFVGADKMKLQFKPYARVSTWPSCAAEVNPGVPRSDPADGSLARGVIPLTIAEVVKFQIYWS